MSTYYPKLEDIYARPANAAAGFYLAEIRNTVLIRFTVSYAAGTGEITTNHDTSRSAFEEARECIRKGYHDVSLMDFGTGMRSSEREIRIRLDCVDEFYRDSWSN